jgi:hypothetical protein
MDLEGMRCEDQLWGPPSLLSNEYRASFPGGKARPGRDAYHSPPSSAEITTEELFILSQLAPAWRQRDITLLQCEDMKRSNLTRDMTQWQALGNMAVNKRVQ